MQILLLLHEEEYNHNHTDKRNKAYSLEPEKAYPSGEFVIVTKFGSHVLRRLASWLANVIRQGGRLKT